MCPQCSFLAAAEKRAAGAEQRAAAAEQRAAAAAQRLAIVEQRVTAAERRCEGTGVRVCTGADEGKHERRGQAQGTNAGRAQQSADVKAGGRAGGHRHVTDSPMGQLQIEFCLQSSERLRLM